MKQKRLDIYEEEENSRFRSTGSAGREVLTPLQRAIMDGDIDTVAEMLENGEDVNQTVVSSDGYTGTPMMTALALDNSMIRLEMVKLLLNHGASPNAIMCRGRNIALRYVLTHSRTEANLADLIALLVDAGAKPDPDLLDIAEKRCFFSVSYYFRQAGASARPVEETMGNGCCLIPLIIILIVLGIVAYLLSMYKVWPFDGSLTM